MNQLSRLNIGRLALPALFGALGSLCALPAPSATTDISNAPLASAGNSVVKPNLLFILDDSGSMMFDAMPDNAETQQGGSERKYWDTSYNCKWRIDELGQRGNHCDRVDPPFGAAEFNGLFYNPQLTYWPAYKADGTKFPSQTSWTAVVCDPFPSAVTCDNFFNSSYYINGSASVDPLNGAADLIGPYRGAQTWTNQYVKNWYGTAGATTFKRAELLPRDCVLPQRHGCHEHLPAQRVVRRERQDPDRQSFPLYQRDRWQPSDTHQSSDRTQRLSGIAAGERILASGQQHHDHRHHPGESRDYDDRCKRQLPCLLFTVQDCPTHQHGDRKHRARLHQRKGNV